MPEPFLSYGELADRIHQVLGTRPAEATLRTATANRDRPGRGTAITTGMPTPVADRGAGGRAQFDTAAVDAWLAHHPRLVIHRHQQTITAAPFMERGAAIDTARAAGVSWQEIADACASADNTTYTRQWAQQRYGRRGPNVVLSTNPDGPPK